MRASIPYDPWRHRYALGLLAATVVLLLAGGLVTSTGSGLAVPDWPLSFGQVFPEMRGGVLFEHGHRLVAATVGLMTVVLAFWFGRREPRPGVRRLAFLALAAVVAQGLLGGLTVLLRLPAAVSVAHACLAQIVFAIVVALAVTTSRPFFDEARAASPVPAGVGLLAGIATAATYAQVVLGALMRHTGAGLAIPDVPLAFGRIVPPILSFEIGVHFAHRVLALVVAGLVAALAIRCAPLRRHPAIALPARIATTLVLLQILLGGAAVLTRLAIVPATLHVVTGALLFGTLLATTLFAWRRRAPSAAADLRPSEVRA
ncbi:MAG TPA: COX15/CtaA family protein [Candidatus Polarisedimenticolia bacterium]|nr:COX15/CtaA family protein [Candidatus Polarisedimenticolia bacterium]